MRLAKHYKSDADCGHRTLMSGYEHAGILEAKSTAAQQAILEINQSLLEKVQGLQKQVGTIYNRRRAVYSVLTADDLDDVPSMLGLLEADLALNAALRDLRTSILVNERTDIYEKCPSLHEWAMDDYKSTSPLTAIVQPKYVDLLPDGFLTPQETEDLRLTQKGMEWDAKERAKQPREDPARRRMINTLQDMDRRNTTPW
jgi:hypothetical protein